MAIRPFRLTYIDARRLCGVAGCEHTLRMLRGNDPRFRRGAVRDLTEVSRAIHGSNREPPINARGDYRLRDAQYSVLLGFDLARCIERRRFVRRRISLDWVDSGYPRL